MITVEQLAAISVMKAAILEIVDASPQPVRSQALWDSLEERGLSEDLGRACIWFLVDEGVLEFTTQRWLIRRKA